MLIIVLGVGFVNNGNNICVIIKLIIIILDVINNKLFLYVKVWCFVKKYGNVNVIVKEIVLCILYNVIIKVYKFCFGGFLVVGLLLLFLVIIFWNGLMVK